MKRSLITCAVAVPMAALLCSPVAADVRTREKTLIKFEGMLGRVVGLFGGKAAKEGVVSTTTVKGDRKLTMSDNSGQIIDLTEEKIYDLDLKKKEYRVTTFEEMRRRIKEAQEQAQKDSQREAERGEQEKQEPAKEWEVDFEAKETGQKKVIAGHEARQVIMTVTLREKGMTLEDSGGVVMTSDTWLGPELPALKELSDFETRYYKKLYGEESFGLAAEQMATVMAMYPMFKQASDRLKQEGGKLQGTPLASTTTFEAVKSKAALAQSAGQSGGGAGGLGGLLARKIKKPEPPKARTTIFTAEHEIQEVASSVDAASVSLPDGFKEKK